MEMAALLGGWPFPWFFSPPTRRVLLSIGLSLWLSLCGLATSAGPPAAGSRLAFLYFFLEVFLRFGSPPTGRLIERKKNFD